MPQNVPELLDFSSARFLSQVGSQVSLELSVKPRSESGVLLAVSSESDALVLQLLSGSLVLVVDSGAGPEQLSVVTPQLCDGHWHIIKVRQPRNFRGEPATKSYMYESSWFRLANGLLNR